MPVWLKKILFVVVIAVAALSVEHALKLIVEQSATHTLTIKSLPKEGIEVTVAPADKGGKSRGKTSLSLVYEKGTEIKLTAPESFEGGKFSKWLINGKDHSDQIMMDSDKVAIAVFDPPDVIRKNEGEEPENLAKGLERLHIPNKPMYLELDLDGEEKNGKKKGQAILFVGPQIRAGTLPPLSTIKERDRLSKALGQKMMGKVEKGEVPTKEEFDKLTTLTKQVGTIECDVTELKDDMSKVNERLGKVEDVAKKLPEEMRQKVKASEDVIIQKITEGISSLRKEMEATPKEESKPKCSVDGAAPANPQS